MTTVNVKMCSSDVRLIFDGNSILNYTTNGILYGFYWSNAVYSDLIAAGKKCSFHNYSVAGKKTLELIADFPTKMAPNIRPNDIVVFYEMTNQVVDTRSAQTLYDQIIQYRDLVRAKGGKFVVCTCIARMESVDLFTHYSGANTLIRNNSSQFDGVADVAALTQCDTVSDTASGTYYFDQLHPTNALYDLMKTPLYNALLPLL